jgi:autotransporter-associated beta strand protein
VNQTHLAASIFIGSSIVNNDGGMIGGFDSTEFDWFDIGIGNSTIVGGELDGYVYASNTTFKNVAFLPDMQFDGDNIGLAGVVNNQMGIGQGALGDAQGYGYFYGNATIVEDTTLVGGGFANVEFDHIRGNSVTNTTLTVTPGVSLFVGSLQSAGADFRVVNDGMIEELGVDDVFIVTLTELTNRGNIRGSALYMYDTVVDNSGGLIEALDIELENVAITGGELRGSLVVYEQVDLTGTRLSSFGAPGLDISLESSGDLYLQDIQLASNTTFFGYAPGSNSVTFRSGVEVDSEGILGLSFLDFNIEEDLTFDGTGSLLLEEVLVAGTGGLGQQLTIGPQFTVNSMASFGEYSNLGSSSLRIDNQGTIDALELIIDPIGGFDSVAPGLVNTGIIRGDVYIIDGAIDNEGGTIENAYLAGVSVKGGTLRNVTFDPDAYSDGGYDSNARLEDVALEGFTYVAGGVDLALAGEIVNNGDFEFGDYASIQVDGEVRLSGTGTMIFYDQLEFSTTGTGGTVTNEAGHTLLFESPSQLASFGEVEFTNNGTVSFFEAFLTPTFNSQLLPAGSEVPDLSDPENPDAVTTLTEDTLYEVVRPWTNNGLFQAELLVIENGSVFRNAGLLNASAIDLNDATILNDEGSIQGAAIYLNGASYLTGGSAPGVDIEIESDPGSSPAGIASIDLNDAVVNAYSPVEFGGEVGKIFELSISNFESVPTVLVENADTTVTVETTYIDGGTIRLGAGRFQTDYLEPSTVGPVLDWTGGEFALLLEPVALGATADFGTQLDVPDGGTLVAPLGVTIAAGAALNIGGDVQAPTIASDGLLTVGLDNASGSLASEISGTGALHKTGTGTYALLGNNSYTGLTLLQGGWLEVEADENLGDPTSSLQFAGGNLRVAGPTTGASPRNVTFSTTSASIDLADAGAIFEINSATATAAELNLTKSGPGTLNIRSAINLNRGRLVVAGGELNFFGNLVQLPGVSQPHAANGVNGQSGLSAGDIAISGGTLTGATITANGGNGGDGGNGTGSSSTSVNGRFGGAGARGGNILIVAGELIANRPITLRGGTGGDGGDGINAFVFSGNGGGGGRGGDGGSIILSGGELVMQSSINLSAGIGGFGGNGAFTAPDGPNGSAGILGTLRVQGGTLTTSAGLLDSGLNGNLSFTSGAIRFTDEVFGLGGSARLNAVLGATSKVLTPNKTLRFDNTLAMTAGQSLVINGGSLIAGTIDNSLGGNLAFLSGRLQTGDYQGDLTQQGGTFAPGASPAEVELAGDYLQSGGVLEIEIGGTNPGEFDALTVTGDVTLAGELQTILLGDFVPTLGQSWQVLTVDGMLNGEFADLPEASLFGTYGNYQLQVTYAGGDGNDVVLTTAPLLAGDLNADGRVDAADYTVWRDNLGSAGQASFTFGDSDGDGDTDHDDYAIWRQNFGASVAALSDANVSVPEPAALAIAGLAILCLRLVRSSWQNNQSEIDESIV